MTDGFRLSGALGVDRSVECLWRGLEICLFSGYRLLTFDETNYLIKTRTVNGGLAYNTMHLTSESTGTPIPVEGERASYGLIIYPDDYKGARDEDTVEEIEACGALFIPCSGYRNWKVPDQALIANDGLGYFMFYSETSATESFCFGYSTELYKTYFEYHEMNTRPGLIRLAKDVVPAAE